MDTTVSQMSVGDLRQLIGDVVDEKLAKYLDPDHGFELREEVVEMLHRQSREVEAGTANFFTFEEVLADLDIEKSEIEAVENVSAPVS